MNAEDRDPLLVAINRMYSELDPPPAGLTERVLAALAVDDLDLEYELLTMVHRSQQLAGVRSADDQKLVLEFTAVGMTVMLRVSPVDAGHRRIDGWVTRTADASGDAPDLTASLWQEQGTHTAGVGSHGRFEFAGVPRGLTRLDLLATGSDSAFRTTLFEI
ncbi:hypothetical protein [Micropruina sp.]|uniref:hypothetical protein n=1 Tax=Micropruina sp. TaxID=2737536 RepID=UPI00260D2743|nr:hypothetical protein [Micropruina sp.]